MELKTRLQTAEKRELLLLSGGDTHTDTHTRKMYVHIERMFLCQYTNKETRKHTPTYTQTHAIYDHHS